MKRAGGASALTGAGRLAAITAGASLGDEESGRDMPDDDPAEAAELERVADWRIKKLGADPSDAESATAAKLLQKLADDLRRLGESPVYAEYRAICGWLDEYDGMEDFADRADAYRRRIGIDQFPASGEEYLRTLTEFARDTFGA
jgi:hypothetical protein